MMCRYKKVIVVYCDVKETQIYILQAEYREF